MGGFLSRLSHVPSHLIRRPSPRRCLRCASLVGDRESTSCVVCGRMACLDLDAQKICPRYLTGRTTLLAFAPKGPNDSSASGPIGIRSTPSLGLTVSLWRVLASCLMSGILHPKKNCLRRCDIKSLAFIASFLLPDLVHSSPKSKKR